MDLKQIRDRLDSVDEAERLAEIWGLSGAEQARLFEVAQGFQPIALQSMLGVNEGKNSLLAFTQFAKVFYPSPEGANELYGFNRNPWVVRTFVGPGYYVAYADGAEVVVDYTKLPKSKPDGWPAIASNSSRLAVVVYNGTKDVLRGVSKHVTIGRATRGGKAMDNWFVLCRTGGEGVGVTP